jgi:hypothetical protein
MSQFPSGKQILERTVLNRVLGDRTIKMADPEAELTRWDLRYSGLTDVELGKIEDLFVGCEGRLRSFTFLDPFGNLLRWTEDLSRPVWESSMQSVSGVQDPFGGTSAWTVTNAAQAAQTLAQSVDAPGWYRYAFSVWVRSQSTDVLGLQLSNAGGTISAVRAISSDWQRVMVSGEVAGEADDIRCSIEVHAACAVDLYGPQLEAQADASGYRSTTDISGLYLARFDQDTFERVSDGPDNHSIRLRVVTVRGESS